MKLEFSENVDSALTACLIYYSIFQLKLVLMTYYTGCTTFWRLLLFNGNQLTMLGYYRLSYHLLSGIV